MSLVLTRMLNLHANSNFDKNELRPSRYGALDAFMVQSNDPTGILTPEIKEKARVSIGRTLETPVIDYDGNIQIDNTRSLLIGDSENTSRMLSINFATYSFGFTIAPALYMNNEIKIQRDFETKLMKYVYKLAKVLDSAAIATLAANKTQIVNNSLLYTNTAGQISADWDQRENLFGDLDVMMAANDFFKGLHIIGDAGVESIMKKLEQKGLYNIQNKQNEFGGKVVHFTNSLAAATGKYAQGYAVEAGTLGLLHRFERDCLLGTVSGDGHEWGIATLPMLGLPIGTYFYDSVGDYSYMAGNATADMTRTRKEHYGFAVDLAFVVAYNSDPTTLAQPIMGFDVNSANAKYGEPVYVVNQ